MLCGHFFLKLSKAADYQDASFVSSVQVGALGGLLMAIPELIVERMVLKFLSYPLLSSRPKLADNESVESSQHTVTANMLFFSAVLAIPATIGMLVASGAGIGYFGSVVLRAMGHNTLGELYATRAGAVGAAILGPGALMILLFCLALCCGVPMVALFLYLQPRAEETPLADLERAPDATV